MLPAVAVAPLVIPQGLGQPVHESLHPCLVFIANLSLKALPRRFFDIQSMEYTSVLRPGETELGGGVICALPTHPHALHYLFLEVPKGLQQHTCTALKQALQRWY